MILPIYYTQDELNEILQRSKIDLDTTIKDCKQYMSMNGWTVAKNRIVKKESLVLHGNIIKKAIDFEGREVHIQKREEIIASLMENERDAFLVCIIEAIKRQI